jgi:hypothetical protein
MNILTYQHMDIIQYNFLFLALHDMRHGLDSNFNWATSEHKGRCLVLKRGMRTPRDKRAGRKLVLSYF